MAENLNYRPLDQDHVTSWCYEDKPENCQKHGRLYDWNAATVVCPPGWALPDDNMWSMLLDDAENFCDPNYIEDEQKYRDSYDDERIKRSALCKDQGCRDSVQLAWDLEWNQRIKIGAYKCSFNALKERAAGDSGLAFALLAGGYRNDQGEFKDIDNESVFWSASEDDSVNASSRRFPRNGILLPSIADKRSGFHVRCVYKN